MTRGRYCPRSYLISISITKAHPGTILINLRTIHIAGTGALKSPHYQKYSELMTKTLRLIHTTRMIWHTSKVTGDEDMLIAKFGTDGVSDEISKIESRYSITFPKQYKDFLLRYNGGYTPKTKFRAKGISSDIKGFYGLGAVGLSVNREVIASWISQELFPIACDSFGNILFICFASDNYESIFFGDHEKGMKLSLIANDFSSFIRACKSDKLPEAALRSIEERKAALIERGRGHIITPALIEMWQVELDKYGNMRQEEVVI